MSRFVKTRIIKIGNSQGVRIPKLFIDQLGLSGEVEMEAQEDRLIIHPSRPPRQGWDAQFQAMAQQGDDRLLDADALPLTQWDAEEWEW